jgi:hypothetical protein
MKKVFLEELFPQSNQLKYNNLIRFVKLAFEDNFDEEIFDEYYSSAFYFVSNEYLSDSDINLTLEVLNHVITDMRNWLNESQIDTWG